MSIELIGWPEVRAHPASIVGPQIMALLELWLDCKKGDRLPFAGGLADQPSLVMSAFSAMDDAERILQVL